MIYVRNYQLAVELGPNCLLRLHGHYFIVFLCCLSWTPDFSVHFAHIHSIAILYVLLMKQSHICGDQLYKQEVNFLQSSPPTAISFAYKLCNLNMLDKALHMLPYGRLQLQFQVWWLESRHVEAVHVAFRLRDYNSFLP